jgi:hypothetical protein
MGGGDFLRGNIFFFCTPIEEIFSLRLWFRHIVGKFNTVYRKIPVYISEKSVYRYVGISVYRTVYRYTEQSYFKQVTKIESNFLTSHCTNIVK